MASLNLSASLQPSQFKLSSVYIASRRQFPRALSLKPYRISDIRALSFSPLPEHQRTYVQSRFPSKTWGCSLDGSWCVRRHEKEYQIVCLAAAAADAEDHEVASSKVENSTQKSALVTGGFFFMWYFLNVIFNILNKKVYNYFPYPYFVSVVHLMVGVAYCLVCWSVGLPKRAPIDKELFLLLTPVAFCHALGHVMTNVSFATVAVSFTHTIKALEPFFNAAASQFVLGHQIPFALWLSLAPVVIGVSMASLTELSFNWTGFISAMVSNIAFTYRSIYSKKAMTGMDSTNVYAYISIIALLFCLPPAIIIEGPQLAQHGFADAIAKVGLYKFLSDLFWIGMFYHLYNQVATNTLERVAPLTHAVGNVLKRVFVIGFSIVAFGNKISTQTGIGTVIAIVGVALYSLIKANMEEHKKAAAS
ncbi:hypothetical protein AMTRI_Chr10g240 [Amborella trichopoda]